MNKKLVLGFIAALFVVSSIGVAYASPITLDELKAWFDLWHLVDWTPTKEAVLSISENIEGKVAHERLEVEVQTIDYYTVIAIPEGSSSWPLYDTVIGGADDDSDAYILVSFRGERMDATVTLTVMDGNKYSWGTNMYSLQTGIYDAYIDAGTGVPAGSYLVVVEATYVDAGHTYYGTASYVIDCTAETS